jgi:putative redox protein
MKAEVTWIEENAFAGKSGSNHYMTMDASGGGGHSASPSPMELLLLALAGCSGIDIRGIFRKMRQDVDGITIAVSGQRAEREPKVFTGIHMAYRIKGHGLDPAKIERAVDLSLNRYCSVAATLKHTARITRDITITDEARGLKAASSQAG